MPSVKDFKKNHKNATDSKNGEQNIEKKHESHPHHKRRPGRDKASHEVEHETSHEVSLEAQDEKKQASAELPPEPAVAGVHQHETETHEHEPKKVEISFFGSEILRAKLPKPFAVAEAVATDWVNDGKFEGLPLGHPLAQVAAAEGLRRAKDLEKKILESGVIEKVAMQALTAGMKAQGEFNSIREQVREKFGNKFGKK